MNCECIYFSPKAKTEEDYKILAEKIKKMNVELYPVTISEIIGDTEVKPDYDLLGRKKIIPDKSKVLFVSGKLFNMKKFRFADRTYQAWFPSNRKTFKFKDICSV